MSKTLSTVAVDVIDAYGNTAKHMIQAYRFGGERVIGFVDQRFQAAVERGAAALREDWRSGLIGAEKRLSGAYAKGLLMGSARAEQAVETAVDLAHKGVERFAANAERFDQATKFGALDMINRVALPAATAMSAVVFRLEQGTGELAKKVAGEPKVVKAVAKKARAAKQAAAKTAGKAGAAKRTVVRKTRAAARKVAA
ncbi:MAG: hypothetical protein J0L57_03090 [Burkholderiales bacterium]|nr:hypothetical protein [Burkholderiales bacterium]